MPTRAKRTGQRVWVEIGSDTPLSYGRPLAELGKLGESRPVSSKRAATSRTAITREVTSEGGAVSDTADGLGTHGAAPLGSVTQYRASPLRDGSCGRAPRGVPFKRKSA